MRHLSLSLSLVHQLRSPIKTDGRLQLTEAIALPPNTADVAEEMGPSDKLLSSYFGQDGPGPAIHIIMELLTREYSRVWTVFSTRANLNPEIAPTSLL